MELQKQPAKDFGIRIDVATQYVEDQSEPSVSEYFFAYTVRITNSGAKPAQLINRHWIITDGLGRTKNVKGSGVVGEQPWIGPGETFEYSSYCPLPTPTGMMCGRYQMVRDGGECFAVEIPTFYLVEPNSYH